MCWRFFWLGGGWRRWSVTIELSNAGQSAKIPNEEIISAMARFNWTPENQPEIYSALKLAQKKINEEKSEG